jgi:predicted P-loop ATPase/GTPase
MFGLNRPVGTFVVDDVLYSLFDKPGIDHPFVNPQMNYRYQTHLMSKPQQNLSNNMTTYNVQQTSSVASSNFIRQIHQQMTNKNQSAYRPCTQNVILMQMLMDDIAVPGIRSDNVHALPQRNQSTYVESISKEHSSED